ncbi:MAG: hypothetical protein AB7O93_16660, partial [Vicinamibacterales bacterium]
WHCNPPAKSGDTGRLFQRIIATALEIMATRHAHPPTRIMSAAAAADALKALESPAPKPGRRTTRSAAAAKRPARARKTER